jgi:glutaconyl-CoA/methylmalonyl-CoA decarboxylase subunit gamma
MNRDYKFRVHGNKYEVKILRRDEQGARLSVNGTEYNIEFIDDQPAVSTPAFTRTKVITSSVDKQPGTVDPAKEIGPGLVKAPLPGTIFKLLVRDGDKIQPGQTVLIMEAMKMENEIHCASGGIVKEIRIKEGDSVLEGDVLVVIQN